MANDTYAVQARGLVKRFGKTTALDGVDLNVRAGTVLGLLGPNGAGKTTAVRALATLIRPDEGEARICGYDVAKEAHRVRQLIGLTGQYASVDGGLSGTNNLIMIGRLLGLSRRNAKSKARELLERFELTEAAARPASTYSGGMRRRLDLAASLVGSPRVLFLDEPTTGLDPRSRNELWGIIRGLTADGVTVLLTTQYLEEADQLAHDITVIDRGAVIATGTPDELKAAAGTRVLQVRPADRGRLADASTVISERIGAAASVDADSGVVSAQVSDGTELPTVVRALDGKGIELTEFTLRKASLDEVFLALTGDSPAKAEAEDEVEVEAPPAEEQRPAAEQPPVAEKRVAEKPVAEKPDGQKPLLAEKSAPKAEQPPTAVEQLPAVERPPVAKKRSAKKHPATEKPPAAAKPPAEKPPVAAEEPPAKEPPAEEKPPAAEQQRVTKEFRTEEFRTQTSPGLVQVTYLQMTFQQPAPTATNGGTDDDA